MKPEYQEPNIDPKLLAPYNPTETERRIYQMWEESGLFNPDVCIEKGYTAPDAPSHTIIVPPPNVTGVLHMGHALGGTIQDILTRYHRMTGKKTLLLPGTDHAAIATQSKVEKEIQKKEGKNRFDLGREELLSRVEAFAQASHDTIISQFKTLGISADWSREAFTLDEQRSFAVRTMFKKMYDDGLIYRGHRIVNWDTKGQTTIADDEIVYKEEKTQFYYLKYGPFVIGTARPETKFGDKYVVMHPADARYAQYTHGDKITVEWINGPIDATIIKDESIDMEFGTGVMTITPWHSVVDFEIAEKYKLDKEQIIDKYGKLLPVAGEFAGMKIKDAREKIIEKLASKGLVEKIEDYTHNIATAERTDGIIEPQIMNQWFVDVNKKILARENKSLKELMIEVIKNEEIKLFPEYFDKTYYHWIENLRDWCISRQIWYGHRIPVWYNGSEVYCGTEAPSGADWTQDEDTLDTWFSSGMWSFSTLDWPNEGAKDLQTYHPTTTLVTAYEILFFWVARMIMMSKYALGDIPFKNVYLTGVVRDAQGRKLSKSLGNGIDPLDVAEKFGMDAGRMALITGGGPGTDSKIDENKIKGYKNFANKLWNITRFILSYQEGNDAPVDFMQSTYEQEQYDAWRATLTDITSDIENFRLHLASEKLYHYAWHSFADIILEDAKTVFLSDDQNAKNIRFQFLITLWKEVITALHPFIPFVTEEIWSLLPKTEQEKDAILMVSVWPSQRINKQ